MAGTVNPGPGWVPTTVVGQAKLIEYDDNDNRTVGTRDRLVEVGPRVRGGRLMAALTSPLPHAYLAQVQPGDYLQWAGRVHHVTQVTAHFIQCDDGTTIRKDGVS